jgi:hypothetical protein
VQVRSVFLPASYRHCPLVTLARGMYVACDSQALQVPRRAALAIRQGSGAPVGSGQLN